MHTELPDRISGFHNKIRELRQKTQAVDEPPMYRLPRSLSIYFTYVLLDTPVTPNAVTFIHFGCYLAAAWLFALGSWSHAAVAAAMLLASYVIDCIDGELARARNTTSKLGSQLEQMVHWVGGGVILAGAAVGAARDGQGTAAWMVGLGALIGHTTFFYMYTQLNAHATPNVNYGVLHPITRVLYVCMPIDTNLLILGGVTNSVYSALMAWMVISNLGWFVVFFCYYKTETSLGKTPFAATAQAQTSATNPVDADFPVATEQP